MARDRLAERIAARARVAGVAVESSVADQLGRYLDLLARWNERMNLTGLADDDAGLDRLVVEPLAAAARLPAGKLRMIDIGSGGGSPALPMRLARPDVQLRMVESKSRKAAFLREAVRQLGLAEAHVDACRYEELATRVGDEGVADVVTVRAVRLDEEGCARLSRLVVRGGRLLLFEGPDGNGAELGSTRFVHEGTCALVAALKSRLVVLRRIGNEKQK